MMRHNQDHSSSRRKIGTGSIGPVEKWCHQDTKSQRFLKVKIIQIFSSCLGAFVAKRGFSSALLGNFRVRSPYFLDHFENGLYDQILLFEMNRVAAPISYYQPGSRREITVRPNEFLPEVFDLPGLACAQAPGSRTLFNHLLG
jgi:hypothetical protein